MRMRLFVSHSTSSDTILTERDGSEDRRFLCDLSSRLEAFEQGGERLFNVIWDYKDFKAGDHWRTKILRGLGGCDAGIVLLNKQAIAQSDWVHAEASILRWREWLGECYPLILIFRGQGSRAAFDADGKWAPLAFNEIQFLDHGNELVGPAMTDSTFMELIERLREADRHSVKSRYELLREGIESKLLSAASHDPGRKASVSEEASGLLEKGPTGIHDLLERWGYLLNREQKGAIIDFVAPWWINPESSCLLAKAARKEERCNAFSVTGCYVGYTPKMYIQHACVQPPDSSWKVAPVLAKSGLQDGPALYRTIVDEVRAGLIRCYMTCWEDPDNVSDDEINLQISVMRDAGQPTFVALPQHVAGNPQLVRAIWEVFPELALLHLTRTSREAIRIAGCEALIPLPEPEMEEQAYRVYRGAKGRC